MENMTCKTCGAAINRIENICVCKWCGNKWEIARNDDMQAVERANAWNELRNGDFERASELFEEILLKDAKNHEAYWGHALALGGIVYVTDINENKKVPTCNNITEESFLSSKDVQKAISLAPSDIAQSYRQQSEYIEKVRMEWLEKASKEPEYDVFLSFKDSDLENGIERTQDSIDAQDLYNALVAEGYHVFFSRISLRDKISEQYEPYIYNAIKTAKVMIVFGEKAEYFSSVWIKNEWSRFRMRIEKGEKHKNSLVVVYKNMNPGDLPAGLKSRQCLNASGMTFFTDLVRHIQRVVEDSKKNVRLEKIEIVGGQISKKATTLSVNSVKTREIGTASDAETNISEKQTISLINMYLGAKDWAEAEKLIGDVLFDNPTCAEAIWLQILARNKAINEIAFFKNLSLQNAGFHDFDLLEKLLNCSSKDFAAHILNSFYDIDFSVEELHAAVLERILPYSYPGREQKIKKAFEKAIQKKHTKAFDKLIGTLGADEVDRYISYHLAFVKATDNYDVKTKCLKCIFSVDEGNVDALRAFVDISLSLDVALEKMIVAFESLLKYTDNADQEVLLAMDILLQERYTLRNNGVAFMKQLLKYYSGNILDLKRRLLNFADRLLNTDYRKEAEYYYNLVLSVDKDCAEAYWGLCLYRIGARAESDIVECTCSIKSCSEFNKYLTLVDDARREHCIELAAEQSLTIEEKINYTKKRISNLVGINQSLEVEKEQLRKNKKTTPTSVRLTAKIFVIWSIALILFIILAFPMTYIDFNRQAVGSVVYDIYLIVMTGLGVVWVYGFLIGFFSGCSVIKLRDKHEDFFPCFLENLVTIGLRGFIGAVREISAAKKKVLQEISAIDRTLNLNNEEISRLEKELKTKYKV